MWIKIHHADFRVPVRAITCERRRWHILGSDLCRLLGYKNTSQFNQRYIHKTIRDVVPQFAWRKLTEQDLNTRVMCWDQLSEKCEMLSEILLLQRMFSPFENDGMKVRKLSPDDDVSMHRSMAREIEVSDMVKEARTCDGYSPASDDEEDEDDPLRLDNYLQSYESAIEDHLEAIKCGGVVGWKAVKSPDAPDRVRIRFGDGVSIDYVKAQ